MMVVLEAFDGTHVTFYDVVRLETEAYARPNKAPGVYVKMDIAKGSQKERYARRVVSAA